MTLNFIPKAQLLNGIGLSLVYAGYLLESSGNLYLNKNYQLSTATSILCLEESSRGMYLCRKYIKKESITFDEWKNLRHHNFKLTDSIKQAKKLINAETKSSFYNKIKDIENSMNIKLAVSNQKEAFKKLNTDLIDHRLLAKVKESCFYPMWKDRKIWFGFGDIKEKEQSELSFLILSKCSYGFLCLKLFIENIENAWRKIGKQINIFTTYDEYRKPSNYESIKEMNEWAEMDYESRKKLDQGRKILRKYFTSAKFD